MKRRYLNVPCSDCLALKNRNLEFPWNKGYVFRSENTEAPFLGICFGERTNFPGEKFDNPKGLNHFYSDFQFNNNFKYGFFL